MSGVGQIVLDHFSEAIIHTVFTSFGQMARGKYKRHTEWRGKRFRGEYQGNAQVPQKPDVTSGVNHVAQ
jgi:hypothetical protein